jgi:hypothetical protein
MNNIVVVIPPKHRSEIIKLLRKRLFTLEDDLSYYKEMIALYWKNSDKANPRTVTQFANLNHCKTRARIIRKELKLIRESLKALK